MPAKIRNFLIFLMTKLQELIKIVFNSHDLIKYLKVNNFKGSKEKPCAKKIIINPYLINKQLNQHIKDTRFNFLE